MVVVDAGDDPAVAVQQLSCNNTNKNSHHYDHNQS